MARFTLVFVWGTDLDEVLPEATADALADVDDGWQRSGKVFVRRSAPGLHPPLAFPVSVLRIAAGLPADV
jgi:hypothetical protein